MRKSWKNQNNGTTTTCLVQSKMSTLGNCSYRLISSSHICAKHDGQFSGARLPQCTATSHHPTSRNDLSNVHWECKDMIQCFILISHQRLCCVAFNLNAVKMVMHCEQISYSTSSILNIFIYICQCQAEVLGNVSWCNVKIRITQPLQLWRSRLLNILMFCRRNS